MWVIASFCVPVYPVAGTGSWEWRSRPLQPPFQLPLQNELHYCRREADQCTPKPGWSSPRDMETVVFTLFTWNELYKTECSHRKVKKIKNKLNAVNSFCGFGYRSCNHLISELKNTEMPPKNCISSNGHWKLAPNSVPISLQVNGSKKHVYKLVEKMLKQTLYNWQFFEKQFHRHGLSH